MTAARDALSKENDKLKAEIKTLKPRAPERKLLVANVTGAKGAAVLRSPCSLEREPVSVFHRQKGRLEHENV
jgi:hypothetical protein